MRMIDADALKDRLQTLSYDDWNQGVSTTWANAYAECADMVEDMPTIEPERNSGQWIYGEHDTAMCDGYRCDKCGFFVPWDYRFTFIDFINDYHFCPQCGARMLNGR